MRPSHWRLVLLSTSVLSLAAPAAALAADQPAPAAPAAAAPATQTVGEILVTARRKSESLQKVPVAVTALNASALEQKSVVTAADLQFHVPSLQENNGAYFLGAEPSFVLRGLSTTSPGTNADPSVETYFNEVPVLNTRQIADELYDLQSVQVLRGPQGTLFGKNSDGGAILFSPNKPSRNFEGMAQAEIGDYDLYQFTGAVNLPVNDIMDVRFSTRDAQRGPYIQNVSGPGMDTSRYQAARLQVELRPTDRLTNDTMIDGYHSRMQGTALIPFNFGGSPSAFYNGYGTFNFIFPGALTAAQYAALVPVPLAQQLSDQQAWGPRKVSSPIGNPIDLDVYTISNTTTYQLNDEITLKNIVGYQHQRTAWFLSQANEPTPVLTDDFHDSQSQVSEEFQVQGKSLEKHLDWILGGYYAHQDETTENDNVILPPLITNAIHSVSATDSRAIFAQATYDFSQWIKGLDFTAGYRYSWDTKSQVVSFLGGGIINGQYGVPPVNDVCQLVVASGAPCLRSLSKTFSAPNWTIGMDYHLNDQTMVYVASRKGYKAGGFNPTSAASLFEAYGPETITDVELGAKTQFHVASAPVRFNIAIYHADYGAVTVAPVLPFFGNSTQVVENVKAGATVNGGELEASINPIHDLQLSVSYGLTDAKFNNGAEFVSGFTGTQAAPVPVFTSLSGQPVPGSSHDTVTASVNYRLPLDPKFGDVVSELDYAWRSDQTLAGFPIAHVPAFGIWNLRVDWREIYGSRVDFGVWVKNLADTTYITNQQLLAASLGVDANQYGPPRTIGVDLTYRW